MATSGQAAISTSALMPDSNLASAEASSAASAAAAELFHSLDFVLDQFGDEGKPGSLARLFRDPRQTTPRPQTANPPVRRRPR